MSSRKLFTKMGFCIFTRIFLWVLTAISNFSPVRVYVIISAAEWEYERLRWYLPVFLLTNGSSPRSSTPQSASLTAPLNGAPLRGKCFAPAHVDKPRPASEKAHRGRAFARSAAVSISDFRFTASRRRYRRRSHPLSRQAPRADLPQETSGS